MKNCRAKLNSTGSFILKGLAAWPQLKQLSLEANIEPTLDSQTEVTNATCESSLRRDRSSVLSVLHDSQRETPNRAIEKASTFLLCTTYV